MSGVYAYINMDIYYRLNAESVQYAAEYMSRDSKTKTFLSTVFDCMQKGWVDSFSINKEYIAYVHPCQRLRICKISIGIDDCNHSMFKLINEALNKAFDGNWNKDAECVVELRECIEGFSFDRRILSPLDKIIFKEEDCHLMVSSEDAHNKAYAAPEGFQFDDVVGWHTNLNYGKVLVQPYVVKELFAAEIVDNDLNPGCYRFKDVWNPANAPQQDGSAEGKD